MKEVWKDIKDYEGYYQISNNGRAKSLDRIVKDSRCGQKKISGKILKQKIDVGGYVRYSLSIGSNPKEYMAHRLVAKAFIPNTSDKPFINHKDGVKTNNNLSNLEWCTSSENQIHAHANKLKVNKKGVEAHMSKLSKEEISSIILMRESGESYAKIGKSFGVCAQTICNIINGDTYKKSTITKRALAVNCRNGSLNPMASLKEEDVFKIIKMREGGMYYKEIGQRFSVDPTTIKAIFKRKTWNQLNLNIDYEKIKLNCKRGDSDITGSDALRIARLSTDGLSATDISKKLDFNVSTIRDIIKGRTWYDLTKHVLNA